MASRGKCVETRTKEELCKRRNDKERYRMRYIGFYWYANFLRKFAKYKWLRDVPLTSDKDTKTPCTPLGSAGQKYLSKECCVLAFVPGNHGLLKP